MIEPIMYIGIGFIAAALLVLGVIPLVHARAVRLTMRRLEALTPLSMAEIQAEKDQLRAEFAMSTRRLEMSVEQMKARTSGQLAEIGKKTEAIGRIKLELGEKTAALFALETKERQLSEDLAAARSELGAKTGALEEHERALSSARGELAQVNASFHDTSVTSDSQRVELAALRTQVEALQSRLEGTEKEAKDLRERLERKTGEAETGIRELAEERSRTEQLTGRVAELDRRWVVQTTEMEVVNRRAEELTARLEQQNRSLAERDSAAEHLRTAAETAQRTEADVRTTLAEAEAVHRAATETIRAEKALLEAQLERANEERTRLQVEIAQIKREAEIASAAEREENAVLRERINDVAAEVAQLTAMLEGPDSPVNAILAADARAAAPNGGSPPLAPAAGDGKSSLADRIRALQSRAAGAARAS